MKLRRALLCLAALLLAAALGWLLLHTAVHSPAALSGGQERTLLRMDTARKQHDGPVLPDAQLLPGQTALHL